MSYSVTDLPSRFAEKIDLAPNGCWLWLGKILRNGYGQAWWQGTQQGAHRAIYQILRGPIGTGNHLDHLCKTRRCVNPAHLEEVSRAKNAERGHDDRRMRTWSW